MRKNGKSEPTLQIGPVSCKLVGKNISRGRKPYGNHWGTYGLKGEGGGGAKNAKHCTQIGLQWERMEINVYLFGPNI